MQAGTVGPERLGEITEALIPHRFIRMHWEHLTRWQRFMVFVRLVWTGVAEIPL